MGAMKNLATKRDEASREQVREGIHSADTNVNHLINANSDVFEPTEEDIRELEAWMMQQDTLDNDQREDAMYHEWVEEHGEEAA